MTQDELGAAIGKSKQAISHWEKDPTFEVRERDAMHRRRNDLLATRDAPMPAKQSLWTRIRP